MSSLSCPKGSAEYLLGLLIARSNNSSVSRKGKLIPRKTKAELLRQQFNQKKYGELAKKFSPPKRRKKSNIPKARRKTSLKSVNSGKNSKVVSQRKIKVSKNQTRNTSQQDSNHLNPMRRNHYDLMRNIYTRKRPRHTVPNMALNEKAKNSHDVKRFKKIIKEML